MDTRKVSRREALVEIEEFRQAQGLRYTLLLVLPLACVAIMGVARSQEWGRNYGHQWLLRLGIKCKAQSSQPTIHPVFKEIDAAAWERAIKR
jgi:hypothetical protein